MKDRLDFARIHRRRGLVVPLVLALAATACKGDDPLVVSPGGFDPEITDIRATWVEEGWLGRDPVGTRAVQLFWTLPEAWDGEVFRVYARPGSSGDYFLIATVTSCAARQCVYTDTNVEAGRTYDYFVVAVDERTEQEIGESQARSVSVPAAAQPAMPAGLTAVALDNGVFLRWASAEMPKYRVFLEALDEAVELFEVGSTDGTAYLDPRAVNGTLHTYSVAAVDESGVPSRRSESVSVTPRPDYHAELIYTLSDSAQASGFRFTDTEAENPIVAGTSAEAQWRLESSGTELRIVPRGQTRVTEGIFTTDLSCGPGSEPDCEYVAEAPASSAFGSGPVEVSAGNTYVFEVNVGGQTHFAKIRVQGDTEDTQGRQVVVFDWAYQRVPSEPSLNLSPLAR